MHKRRKRERCMMALTEKIQHSNRVYFSKPKTLLFTVFPLTFDFYFRNLRKEGRRRRGGRYHIRKGKIIGARGTKGIVRSQCIVRCRISFLLNTGKNEASSPRRAPLGGIQTTHNIERTAKMREKRGKVGSLPSSSTVLLSLSPRAEDGKRQQGNLEEEEEEEEAPDSFSRYV